MNLEDKPSIQAYRLRENAYKFALYCGNNKEPVAHSSKDYDTPELCLQALKLTRDEAQWFVGSKRSGKPMAKRKWYFSAYTPLEGQLLESEPYASRQKAVQGVKAVLDSLSHGIIESRSELSNTAHIDSPNALEVIRGVYT